MKIIGFTQLRNELSKGNLENWFKCMLPITEAGLTIINRKLDRRAS